MKPMSIIAATFTLIAASGAHAYTVGDIDVGSEDTILATASLTNSGNQEADFVNTAFAENGIDETYYKDSTNTVESAQAYLVDGSDSVFAFELNDGAGYYLIKNASCPDASACENNTALIQNNEEYGWGVLDLQKLGMFFGSGDDFTISHVTTFGDVAVPEPATIGLLALGLAGIGAARRKKTV